MKRHNFLIFKLFNFYILAAAMLLTSCVDTLILPDNKTVDEDYWQTKGEVQALVTAAYAQLRDATAVRNMVVWGDFRSDELMVNPSLPVSATYKVALSQIYTLNIETENEFTKWYPFYSAINYCNLVLEKAEKVMTVDPDYMQGDYEANKAQAKALRAFCYFYLSRVYHDIPVTPHAYLKSSDDLNAPQETPATVLQMCIDDLEDAVKYAVPGNTYGDFRDKGFLNKDGINALLADIYLWRASVNRDATDYQKCVEYCDKVIAAKKSAYESTPHKQGWGEDNTEQDYYLSDYDDMYEDLFGQNGQNADESIFELQFLNSKIGVNDANNVGLDQMYFCYNATIEKPSTSVQYGYMKASTAYGKSDGTGKTVWPNAKDQRFYEYLYNPDGANIETFDVRKFVATNSAGTSQNGDKNRDTRADYFQNWIFYRLTDVMLMKAEALVQLYVLGGKAEDDARNEEAFNICKFVNDRALSESDKASYSLKYSTYKERMEELVLAERARELCFEGKRWYDLMRYNYRHTEQQADLTKKLTESYVANSDEFFNLAFRKYPAPTTMKAKMRDERYLYMPINQDEIEVNSALEQNPVYKSSSKY